VDTQASGLPKGGFNLIKFLKTRIKIGLGGAISQNWVRIHPQIVIILKVTKI
jgi:hypothetical protein